MLNDVLTIIEGSEMFCVTKALNKMQKEARQQLRPR